MQKDKGFYALAFLSWQAFLAAIIWLFGVELSDTLRRSDYNKTVMLIPDRQSEDDIAP